MEDPGQTIGKIKEIIAVNEKRRDMLLGLTAEIHQLQQMMLGISTLKPVFISSFAGDIRQIELLATDMEPFLAAEIKHRQATLAEAVREIEGKING